MKKERKEEENKSKEGEWGKEAIRARKEEESLLDWWDTTVCIPDLLLGRSECWIGTRGHTDTAGCKMFDIYLLAAKGNNFDLAAQVK